MGFLYSSRGVSDTNECLDEIVSTLKQRCYVGNAKSESFHDKMYITLHSIDTVMVSCFL